MWVGATVSPPRRVMRRSGGWRGPKGSCSTLSIPASRLRLLDGAKKGTFVLGRAGHLSPHRWPAGAVCVLTHRTTGPIFGDWSSLNRSYLAMVDYAQDVLSSPGPNRSAAEVAMGRARLFYLADGPGGIPCRLHVFRLYPYFFEAVGLWLILSRTLLVAAIWLRWGEPALAIALVGLAGGTLDWMFGIPLVTWPLARAPWENLIVELDPAATGREPATQEIVISADYDSKTELLDHRRRAFLCACCRLRHGPHLAGRPFGSGGRPAGSQRTGMGQRSFRSQHRSEPSSCSSCAWGLGLTWRWAGWRSLAQAPLTTAQPALCWPAWPNA